MMVSRLTGNGSSLTGSSASDLLDASASTLQDDHLQEFSSVTLCIVSSIYGQHLEGRRSC